MPPLEPYPGETQEEFEARRARSEAATAIMPQTTWAGDVAGGAAGAAGQKLQDITEQTFSLRNPVMAGAYTLSKGLLGGQAEQQTAEGLKGYLQSRIAPGAPAPAPAGPAGVDPSTLQFSTPGAAQPGAGAAPGSAGGGVGLRMPTGVSTKGLKGAVGKLGELQEQAGTTAKQAIGASAQAAQKAQAANVELAQTQGAAAESIAGIMREGMNTAEQVRNEYAQRMQQAQDRVDESMGKWQEARQDFQSAQVDPSRRYSGGKKVGSAIAMALGALGAALSRSGQNTALNIIQSEIDRDIRAQEQEIAGKRQGVKMAGTELGMARQLFGDEKAARTAAEIAHWDNVSRLIAVDREKYKSPLAQNQADQLNAEIERKQAELEGNLRTRAIEQERTAIGTEIQGETAIAGVQRGNQQLRMQAQAKLAAAKAVSTPPPGLVVIDPKYPPKPKDTLQAQKIGSAYGPVHVAIRDLIKWRMKFGAEALERDEIASGEQYMRRAKAQMRALDEAGANLSDSEIEMMGLDFGVDDVGFVMKKLSTLMNSIDNTTQAKLKYYGYGLSGVTAKEKGRKL